MFINPRTAVEKGWIVFPKWMDNDFKEKCFQPNAIDITLDQLYRVNDSSMFVLSEDTKVMKDATELYPTHERNGSTFYQIPTGCSDFQSDFTVDLPEGVAGYIIVRSTLNRNKIFVTSGLFDSGYDGHVGGCIRNEGITAAIAPHTRIAQFVLVRSDIGGLYSGGYNQDSADDHWSKTTTHSTKKKVIARNIS